MKLQSLLSSNKFPEFIREEYPALVKFIEVYYAFMEEQASIGDAADLDSAAQQYVQLHKDTFARGFSNPKYLDIRKFVASNKEFFSRKGTADAFIYLFKAYFGEEITVRKPSYLQASGAVSGGYHYFYIDKQYGTLEPQDQLIVHVSTGKTKLDIIKVDTLEDGTVVAYFVVPRGFINAVGNVVEVINGTVTKFYGTVKRTPYRVVPLVKGKNWQAGQVLSFPSVIGNTPLIAKVTRVNSDSGVEALDVIQYGAPIRIDTFVVSSLNSISNTVTDYTEFDSVQTSEGVFTHTLGITDFISNLGDTIAVNAVIYNSAFYFGNTGTGRYFLEDYAGTQPVYQVNDPVYNYTVTHPGYDANTLAQSNATFKILYGALAKERHFYISEQSILSNQNTKMHDNLYYQAFAYSIETKQDIGDYLGSLDLIHPAGHKFSAVLNKENLELNTGITVANFNNWPNPAIALNGNSATVSAGKVITTGIRIFGVSGTGAIGNTSI